MVINGRIERKSENEKTKVHSAQTACVTRSAVTCDGGRRVHGA